MQQRDPERRSAPLDALQIDSPAVCLDRPTSDGQPEARPTEITRSRLVDPVETIEHAVAMLRWYARPGVGDLDGGPGRSVPYDDPDAAAGRRVLDGVVHQIDQRLPDHEAIHPCRNGPRRFDRERLPLLLGQHAEVPSDVTGQLGEIDALALEQHVAPVGARERQEPFDEPSELVRLLEHAADDLAIRRCFAMLPETDLADAPHRRERGPELV